ncbi:F-box/kelch-repeat protein [Senna tora]|uniref:F-box/kelch-repeat protein n=1 Tax=Senna tora TaxID=362788 RepID=A0A834T0R6_9FABA|nr:F-box/kelch-repeat protein [Senna tora]
MKDLPEELLLNILLRLPVKSLLRFKSVSKLWHSLISDPHFANSHFQRSSFLSGRLLHIADSQVRSIDFHSSISALVHLNCPIIPPPPSLQIWGSCKGFVVVHNGDHLFVWNPSTGSCKQLTSSPMTSQFVRFIHGFGYDASTDDYLLVLAGGELRYAQFFSMKANSWKEIEGSANFSYCKAVIESSIGSFLNGAIHWLVLGPRTQITDHIVLAFNVTERNFHEIPLLDDFGSLDFCYLGTLGGCLSLCELGEGTTNIWLMKEYGLKSSWTKSFVMSLANIPTNYFCSICLTQSGEIVGTDGESGLVKCNGIGERLYFHSPPVTMVKYEKNMSNIDEAAEFGSILKAFTDVQICHTLREVNMCADMLAKQANLSEGSLVVHNYIPNFLKAYFFADFVGVHRAPGPTLISLPPRFPSSPVTTMNHFPEDLLHNILLRLPVKSLMRFKSVSKLWLSLISDPHFAKSHFQRSPLFPHKLIHIAHSHFVSIDFNSSFHDDSAPVRLRFPIKSLPVQIWGSCRGFVLLDDFQNLFVWNPATGSCKTLPYYPITSQFCILLRGFGYDVSNDDYLIVVAQYDLSDAIRASQFQFFSIKANSWRKIEGGTNFSYATDMILNYSLVGPFLNGAIHWLLCRHDPLDEVILAFNVTKRNLMEIPLPDDYGTDYLFLFLQTLGGCLSLCEIFDDTTNIWLMKEYGMKSSWTKSIVVSLANIPTNYFCSIGLTQSGEIVGTGGGSGLVKCNGNGEVLEYRLFNILAGTVTTYTETLLSLPCGDVREEDEQH